MLFVRMFVAVAAFIAAQAASADGRYYASEYAPEISDQRALIAFDGERQVVLIENSIALPDGRPAKSLGWVVPVPEVPEISTADPGSVRFLYRTLRRSTDATTWPVAPVIGGLAGFCLFVGYSNRRSAHPDMPKLRWSGWIGLIGMLLSSVSLPAYTPAGPGSGVEVVKALQVGPFDAKVVRAGSGSELLDWLKSNGFAYGAKDVAVLDDYLRQKWVFVVATLAPQPGSVYQGASASPPVVLGFPTKEAVYPVALTAVGGGELDLVLYVFASTRVEPSTRMRVAFAGAMSMPSFSDARDKAVAAIFKSLKPTPYLTKLSARLSAEDMRSDLRFAGAAGEGEFRDWQIGSMFELWFGGAAVVGFAALLLQLAGRGLWRCSAFTWFLISACISPLALLFLFGSVVNQWWESRKAPISSGPSS